jgi:ABC-type dipeptide/oligopeptide/nickel transport system ATPase component
MTSLNPTMKIGKQIKEAIKVSQKRKYHIALNNLIKNKRNNVGNNVNYDALIAELKKQYKENIRPQNIKKRIFEILEFIGIKDIANNINKYPNAFSGGMRQRIVIAIAVACEPDLIIADEPTTALDVIVQAKVISLIKRLRDELNISIIFISHNIALVANLCDYIYVMYAGKIIEQGTLNDIFIEPKHPYT